jgi:hypothetical protein
MQEKSLFVMLVLVAVLAIVPAANATVTVKFIGVGSSAMWQEFALAAVNDPTMAGSGAQHWTAKGAASCSGCSGNWAQIVDTRSGAGSLTLAGNLWVVWNSAQTSVWAYISVDSVVGNRAYFSQPRATLEINSAATSNAGQNLINYALFSSGASGSCGSGGATETTCDAASLPSAIYTALNNAKVTTAMTDIRPEDALYAQNRTSAAWTSALTGLGYTGTPVGQAIQSSWSTSVATPDEFAISGTDPLTKETIPASTTFRVGAQPIIILVNRTDTSGLGYQPTSGTYGVTNATHAQLQTIFTGTNCSTSALTGGPSTAHAIYPLLREPMSGTYNTFEFSNMTDPVTPTNSQEKNVGAPVSGSSNNPLNLACLAGGGSRYRGIGTGEIVKQAYTRTSGGTGANGGIYYVADGIGYIFFSYGNVSSLANNTSYGYLTLDGVDPINSSYSKGLLPTCANPCPITAAPWSFPNVRSGSYRSWSMVRAVTDASGTNYTNTSAIVTAAQNNIDTYVPDFIPYPALSNGDPGMLHYRSHYKQSGVSPNNGLSGQTEAGGDVGGCIEAVGPAPGTLSCHQI